MIHPGIVAWFTFFLSSFLVFLLLWTKRYCWIWFVFRLIPSDNIMFEFELCHQQHNSRTLTTLMNWNNLKFEVLLNSILNVCVAKWMNEMLTHTYWPTIWSKHDSLIIWSLAKNHQISFLPVFFLLCKRNKKKTSLCPDSNKQKKLI